MNPSTLTRANEPARYYLLGAFGGLGGGAGLATTGAAPELLFRTLPLSVGGGGFDPFLLHSGGIVLFSWYLHELNPTNFSRWN